MVSNNRGRGGYTYRAAETYPRRKWNQQVLRGESPVRFATFEKRSVLHSLSCGSTCAVVRGGGVAAHGM